jgi:hypothetical protein
MRAQALYLCVLLAGARAQSSSWSSTAFSGVVTSTTSSSSTIPAGAAPSSTSRSPSSTLTTTSFTTSLDISVDGRKSPVWERALTYLRFMEYLRWACRSLLREHYSISNSSPIERACSTAVTLLFAISQWATKSGGCQERELVISQGLLVGCSVCSVSS